MEVTYGKRKHRGGLQESLNTSVEISVEKFKELLNDKHNNYNFYGYDSRCKQILFCGNYDLEYMWLYIQLKLDVEHSIESKLINTIEQLMHIVQEQENEIVKYKQGVSLIGLASAINALKLEEQKDGTLKKCEVTK